MTVIMFKHRFAQLVADGTKSQTIRPERKRPVHVGDALSLRRWADKAYRSPQVVLRETTCIGLDRVEVCLLSVHVNGRRLSDAERDDFARADGFADGAEMADWFDNVHGLPFGGVLIRWEVRQ